MMAVKSSNDSMCESVGFGFFWSCWMRFIVFYSELCACVCMYAYTLNGWLIFPSFIFFALRGKSFARVHVKLRLYTLENSVARTEISLSLSCECARESVDVLPWRSIRKERGDDLWRNLFKDGGELVCAREVLVCVVNSCSQKCGFSDKDRWYEYF